MKKAKKAKKSEKKKKKEKIDLNFASLCFVSKQKWLIRSEAKNLKRKKRKKLRFVVLRSENYSSEAKRKIWSENKRKKRSEIL